MTSPTETGEELVARLRYLSMPDQNGQKLPHADTFAEAAAFIESRLRPLAADEDAEIALIREKLEGGYYYGAANDAIDKLLSDRDALKSLAAEEWNRAIEEAALALIAYTPPPPCDVYGPQYEDAVNYAVDFLAGAVLAIRALKRPTQDTEAGNGP